MEGKINFWDIFSQFFLDCVLASILGGFLEAPNPENMHGASTGARFLQNRRYRKSIQKSWILAPFSEAETEKNQQKTMLEYMLFLDIGFLVIFCDF